MMMAMLRLNVPSVFLYGGSILPGRWHGRDVTVVDVFEGVGMHSAGKMSLDDLCDLERHACPGDGACGGQFTANTMACVSEAIGLALPLSAALPAPYESRDQYAVASGEAVVRLIERNIRPRDICTRKAFENAAVVVAATGGSTNGGLHLPAMAHECGVDFTLRDFAEIARRTPYLADLKPGGRYVAKDMGEAGGVPVLLKTLLDGGFIHGDVHDRHRQDDGREPRRREVARRPGRDPPGLQPAVADRRARRPLGLARAGRAPSSRSPA